jgi:hypothetical protein
MQLATARVSYRGGGDLVLDEIRRGHLEVKSSLPPKGWIEIHGKPRTPHESH